jgi:hypothetical protein
MTGRSSSLPFVQAFVALLVLGASGSAAAFEVPQAVQSHSAWVRARTEARDCEQTYRSFRARNTQRPSERRAARERCLDAAAAASREEKKLPQREVALGE